MLSAIADSTATGAIVSQARPVQYRAIEIIAMAPTPALGELPEETLINVMSLLPQSSLLVVAQSSRRLNRVANAELYARVYFEEVDREKKGPLKYFARKALDLEEYLAVEGEAKIKPRQSRIFRLSRFLTTITENPYLRSLIATAAFEQNDLKKSIADPGETPYSQDGLLKVELRPIKSLHLALGQYEIGNPLNLRLASLSVHHSEEVYDIDYLHSLFSIPTLRSLCISGLLWSHPLLRRDDIDRSRTSAVLKLSFPASMPSGNDLAELLTWPKALKYFGLEASSDSRARRPRVRRLVTLLSLQRDTLEEIFLSGDFRHPLLDYSPNRELTTFTALKRLSIRLDWLQQPRRSGNTEAQEASIYDVLPPNLEWLQLEVRLLIEYYDMRWDGSLDEAGLATRCQELVYSLHELMSTKATRHPSLEEVAIWFRKRDDPEALKPGNYMRRIVDYEERICERLFPREGTSQRGYLFAAFEEGGCKLSSCYSVEAPLVDI